MVPGSNDTVLRRPLLCREYRGFFPAALRATGEGLCVADWGMVWLHAAPQVQLFASAYSR